MVFPAFPWFRCDSMRPSAGLEVLGGSAAVGVVGAGLFCSSGGCVVSSASGLSRSSRRPSFSLPSGAFVSGPAPLPSPLVGFVGSRSLPASAAPLVSALVGSVLASGRRVVVGCASGSDALVVSSVLAAGGGRSLSLFCAFGPSGLGALSVSAPPAALVPVVAAGARVLWFAGGGLVAGVLPPPRARLAGRSLSLVRAVAAAPRAGSGVVALVSAPPPRPLPFVSPGAWPSCGSGSWGSAGAAALLGLPVFVFPVGWPGFVPSALPVLPGAPGSWVPASSSPSSPWFGGWRWLAAS